VSAEQGRRLVLFVDNIDRVLDRLAEEQWVVREVLSEPSGPLVLGASGRPLEAAYRYDKAFYDFFKVHELAGVPAEAMVAFLRRYARALALPAVERVPDRQPERWAVLRRLTGGVPRRLVQLVAVVALGSGPSAWDDLGRVLDLATPELLARLESLPRQAQRVVAGLAAHFDPISAGELATRLGLEVNTVSAQLSRLVNHGWVEKVAYHPASKTGFLLADRFFNLWFLSHAGPVEGRHLSDLVDFLERVEAGHAGARELLEGARWPGLRRVVEAAHRGERETLRRLAPELQGPARRLADELG
jgi:DNA-binding transcriptional ArsR family regulator